MIFSADTKNIKVSLHFEVTKAAVARTETRVTFPEHLISERLMTSIVCEQIRLLAGQFFDDPVFGTIPTGPTPLVLVREKTIELTFSGRKQDLASVAEAAVAFTKLVMEETKRNLDWPFSEILKDLAFRVHQLEQDVEELWGRNGQN